MASNFYHFITNWRVQSTAEEVFEILGNAEDLARWWPSVYLEVNVLNSGDKNGVGKIVDLYTKGWLPYTLRWQFRVTEVKKPFGFSLAAWGDFVGRGIWQFHQDGDWVNVTYDWQIRADKPLLNALSWLFKPIFSANHRWAMAKGEESLKLEINRRRGVGAKNHPPGPTFPHNLRYPKKLPSRHPILVGNFWA